MTLFVTIAYFVTQLEFTNSVLRGPSTVAELLVFRNVGLFSILLCILGVLYIWTGSGQTQDRE